MYVKSVFMIIFNDIQIYLEFLNNIANRQGLCWRENEK